MQIKCSNLEIIKMKRNANYKQKTIHLQTNTSTIKRYGRRRSMAIIGIKIPVIAIVAICAGEASQEETQKKSFSFEDLIKQGAKLKSAVINNDDSTGRTTSDTKVIRILGDDYSKKMDAAPLYSGIAKTIESNVLRLMNHPVIQVRDRKSQVSDKMNLLKGSLDPNKTFVLKLFFGENYSTELDAIKDRVKKFNEEADKYIAAIDFESDFVKAMNEVGEKQNDIIDEKKAEISKGSGKNIEDIEDDEAITNLDESPEFKRLGKLHTALQGDLNKLNAIKTRIEQEYGHINLQEAKTDYENASYQVSNTYKPSTSTNSSKRISILTRVPKASSSTSTSEQSISNTLKPPTVVPALKLRTDLNPSTSASSSFTSRQQEETSDPFNERAFSAPRRQDKRALSAPRRQEETSDPLNISKKSVMEKRLAEVVEKRKKEEMEKRLAEVEKKKNRSSAEPNQVVQKKVVPKKVVQKKK
jgi:hypothetical protein